MAPHNPAPRETTEALAGCWHSVGLLELRRLVAEGATLAMDQPMPLPPALEKSMVLISTGASAAEIRRCLPEADTLLVCLGPGWSPAQKLAERLSRWGYQHVFTPKPCAGSHTDADAQNPRGLAAPDLH